MQQQRTQRWEQQQGPRPPWPQAEPRPSPPIGLPAPGSENSYAALAGWRDEEGDEPADTPPREPDAVPPAPSADTEGNAPAPPAVNRAPVELVPEERVVDAFAAGAKAERRRLKTRRKNQRRREESRRNAGADTRLRHGVYEAFARESAVEQGLDPSVWPFVPLSKEAAAGMAQEYAQVEALIHLVERNHRLRPAPLHDPPQAEPPDRPGRRVRFADPLVRGRSGTTGSKKDVSTSRSGREAGVKVSASAKGGGVYNSPVPNPGHDRGHSDVQMARVNLCRSGDSILRGPLHRHRDRGQSPDHPPHGLLPLEPAAVGGHVPLHIAVPDDAAGRDVSEKGWHRAPGWLGPQNTPSPGLAVQRLTVQAAPRRSGLPEFATPAGDDGGGLCDAVKRRRDRASPPPAAARISGAENLGMRRHGDADGKHCGGGRGTVSSAVPTERPRPLRRPQEPPARTGPTPATKRGGPGRVARVAPPAVTADGGGRDDRTPALARRPLTSRSPPALSSPRPPAGGNTHNKSPCPRGGAGGGPSPAAGVGGERASDTPAPPAERLYELAAGNAEFLAANGWRDLVEDRRGRSALNPDVGKIPHAAAAYLDFLRRLGAPTLSMDCPWMPAEVQAAADRGPHPSAEAHRDFLWEEAVEMCQRRHTMVLPL